MDNARAPSSVKEWDSRDVVVPQDLRDLEDEWGMGNRSHEPNDFRSESKGKKHDYEVSVLSSVAEHFSDLEKEHPPHGMPMMSAEYFIELYKNPDLPYEAEYLSQEALDDVLNVDRNPDFHLLEILLEIKLIMQVRTAMSEMLKREPMQALAHILHARDAMGNAHILPEVIIAAAIHNAKRFELTVLREIVRHWQSNIGRWPTVEEFDSVTAESVALLEMMASTNQAIFAAFNSRAVITPITIQSIEGSPFFGLRSKQGKIGLHALKPAITDYKKPTTLPASFRPLRTMCSGLLAQNKEGKSLLELSFRDTQKIVKGITYPNGKPKDMAMEALIGTPFHTDSALEMFEKLM